MSARRGVLCNLLRGGLIVDGRRYGGFSDAAGKLRHMMLDPEGPVCRCGNRGCFETLASRPAVFDRIKLAISAGRKTVLTETLAKVDRLRTRDLRHAFRCGDALVTEIVHSAAHWIGIAIRNLVNVFKPEVVVIGGGMINALGAVMLGSITETAHQHLMGGVLQDVEIMTSSLGDRACVTGGAWLARRMTHEY